MDAPVSMSSTRQLAADALVDSSLLAVCVIRNDMLVYTNERCGELLGRAKVEGPPGVPLREVVAGPHWPRIAERLHEAMRRPGAATSLTFTGARGDGSILELELVGRSVGTGADAAFVAVITDVTRKTWLDTQLNYLAFNDPLTGLPNRSLLLDRLRQCLVGARRTGEGFAVLACDVDDFKTINDTHGHQAGDYALQVTAQRLRACCREVDTAARMGGDEFAVVLPGVAEADDGVRVAGRIMAAVQAPIQLPRGHCGVGVSLGMAFYPRNGETMEALLRSADAAMYASKASGKNVLTFADTANPITPRHGWNVLPWSDLHDTGIALFDRQHRTLAGMISRFGTHLAAGEDMAQLRKSFDAIVEYAQHHFETEEALMERYAVDGREQHHAQHRKLLQDARTLSTALDESGMMFVLNSLHDWLLRHIDSSDMMLAGELREKGFSET